MDKIIIKTLTDTRLTIIYILFMNGDFLRKNYFPQHNYLITYQSVKCHTAYAKQNKQVIGTTGF